MKTRLATVALLLAALAALAAGPTGCSAVVGDACETQTDCGTGLYCELSLPDGYCTRRSCEDDGCPDEGVCIVFSADLSFCMAPCSSASDCRDGYVCVKGFGAHAFCNDARGEPPG